MRVLVKGTFVASLFLGLFSVAQPALMQAQNLTGEIDGVVRDSSGAAVPNATVSIKNLGQNVVQRQVHTDGQGQFVAPLLATGDYSVTVEAPSFQTETVSGITVHLDHPVDIPIVIAAGAVTEAVTVTADNLSLQLENAAAGSLITGTQVRELSLSSRNYQQLLSLQPGITSTVP